MFNNQNSCAAKRSAAVHVKSLVAAMGLVASGSVFAAATGGFSTTDGGNVSGARSFSASTYEQINTIIANAKGARFALPSRSAPLTGPIP